MRKLLLINGPNLSRLGTRNPNVYGSVTLEEVEEQVKELAALHQLKCLCFCDNAEGNIIDFIDQHRDAVAMIINPGALMMSGWSLRDALEDFEGYKLEVHISNLWQRESFRHESVISPVVNGVFSGAGTHGYPLALQAIIHFLRLSRDN
ncbi:3-dehydroquinate dehydratase [Vibrio crassostreae]|nr:3-dehydroquinate dehydratase [Vibrio crassostreae]CAK2773354.1 3-dehydroquinate dehydratase [Vibrio crassostreae]CAK3218938.1 3-dehydroquinate dehydratase [Vibrio crassostreae]CAK3840943.1 3-dehydroquinate dehydratase [Vibrio crassostreae]